jgi:hypothetical protein
MAQERRKRGRRSSDKGARDDKPTLTNERSTGTIEHDERGDARWVWPSEQQAHESIEKTFDELKALDNETLTLLEQSAPSNGKPPPGGGYNPYNTTKPVTAPAPKKTATKGRR